MNTILNEGHSGGLLFALPRVAAFARLVREQPEVCEGHLDGQIAYLPDDFEPTASELRGEQLNWKHMIPPPEPLPGLVAFDESTRVRLLKLTQAKGFHLELDVAYSTMVIAAPERPFFPKLALAVDRASGFVGGFHLSDCQDGDGSASLGRVLQDALQQLGQRPQTIRVQRARVAAMLSKVAKELGIPVLCDAELPALNFTRHGLEQRFSR
jgi:hypothetical protein